MLYTRSWAAVFLRKFIKKLLKWNLWIEAFLLSER